MTTRAQAAKVIDDAADAVASADPVFPLLHGNVLDTSLSLAQNSYVRQRSYFPEDNQLFLGNQDSSRHRGTVVFTIYVRRGKGDGDRNLIADRIIKAFRSKQFGGVTFLDAREMPNSDTDNWCLTGIQIPFYFDEV
jgi:hypothetical protein